MASASGAVFTGPALLGQEPGWNQPRALEMVDAAREVRQGFARDLSLRSYSSNARGYVYFYLDREDTGERILVKTDQIALEVYWQAPDRFKQRIVGLRDEKSLPTNIRYHLDHLVVVQDEFGDRIRIGDGDEVEAVMHPLAPGSEAVYDFLLADSVTLNLPSTSDTVRVYEVMVRPKDFQVPGFVGSVYLDRSTMSIVRMSFTFTPASYVDDYLEHISISLENGLWMGQYWLPYRQQLEIRREVPFLDIPAGSVIRGSFQVRDYEINPRLPPELFIGRTITALPDSARRSFPFEDDLFAQLEEEGFGGFQPPPDMEEVRSMALSMARNQVLGGLGRTRLFLPSPIVSSGLRYNRSEGFFLGAGLSHAPRPDISLFGYAGYSFGRQRPSLEGRLTGGEQRPASSLRLFLNRPLDLGPVPAVAGVLNSLAAAVTQDDFTDLYFSSGARVDHTLSWGSGRDLTLTARLERHRAAGDVVSADLETTHFRPVLPVDRGVWGSLGVTGSFPMPWDGLRVTVRTEGGRFEDRTFGSVAGEISFLRRWMVQGAELRFDLQSGSLVGEPPVQAHYFLGGRETVPGYAFRSRAGDRFWLARTEVGVDIFPPFLRIRAIAAAGDTRDVQLPGPPPSSDSTNSSFLLTAGVGLGLGWDVLRIDLARGLRSGGEWAVILSVKPDFWPWL